MTEQVIELERILQLLPENERLRYVEKREEEITKRVEEVEKTKREKNKDEAATERTRITVTGNCF